MTARGSRRLYEMRRVGRHGPPSGIGDNIKADCYANRPIGVWRLPDPNLAGFASCPNPCLALVSAVVRERASRMKLVSFPREGKRQLVRLQKDIVTWPVSLTLIDKRLIGCRNALTALFQSFSGSMHEAQRREREVSRPDYIHQSLSCQNLNHSQACSGFALFVKSEDTQHVLCDSAN